MRKGAANILGAISLLNDLGAKANSTVHSDASVAIGIVNRQGAGKLRHVKVQYLWMQDLVKNREVQVSKVSGERNTAEMMKKNLDSATMCEHFGNDGPGEVGWSCVDGAYAPPNAKSRVDLRHHSA